MAISHLLEDYSEFKADASLSLTDVSREEQRLAAFESGYEAGWDDSQKAHAEDMTQISADLAQNLRELSFTYQEAYSAMLDSIAPLLKEMVDTVLPRAAHETLGTRISEEILDLAKEIGQQTVEIVTAPGNLTAVEETLTQDLPFPVSVKSEVSLGEGQALIRFGEAERDVNLSAVVKDIEQAVTGFFEENQKDSA